MRPPRVSVITAVRNGEPYIAQAIDSVFAQGVSVQYIIVDDGSTDATPDIVGAYGNQVEYVRQDARGFSTALNRGLSRAQGELIAFIDADDVWAANKLRVQTALLDARPELDLVFGQYVEFASGRALAEPGRWAVRTAPQAGHASGGVLARTALLRRLGGFNEALKLGGFIDLIIRARHAGIRELTTKHIVFHRRVHGENTTIVHRAHMADYLAIARASLLRHRQKRGFRA
jgi:glycosyltransferase involved in cell wall biosynthesis